MPTISIPLTQGQVALIDEEDYPLVSGYRWYAAYEPDTARWMAVAKSGPQIGGRKTKDNRRLVLMHRLIMGAPAGRLVDHRDLNPLNNTRANLRLATGTQNKANGPKYRTNTSGYKGVSQQSGTKRWEANIKAERKSTYLGAFATREEAARAYDAKAREVFGPFARCNFPE